MRFVKSLLNYIITLSVPMLLVLLSVRVVMTPVFLRIEYYRYGFPEDRYGFSADERMRYGEQTLAYLLNDADISYLVALTFDDGTPLYNDRELYHMEDVKSVTSVTFLFLLANGLIFVGIVLILMRIPSGRRWLQDTLFQGAVLTLALIGAIVMLAVLAWDIFFTAFHNLFFESGTWRFLYSDTLIRLFPEQFWFDAALTIGTLTTLGALAILAMTWRRIHPQRRLETG